MTEPRSAWLVINSASGSYSEEAVRQVVAEMQAHGLAPEKIVAIPGDPPPDRTALEAAGVDLLAIFAGDGTVNGVVSGIHDWPGQVLILPGGTQNLLAKALHGEIDFATIIARVGVGEVEQTRRHMVRTSQGEAYCEVLAGPGAHWSDVREAMREGDLGDMATTLGEAIGQTAAGSQVRIEKPPLGSAEGYPAVRIHPQGSALQIDGYGAATLFDYAKQGVALLRRDFRQGPHDELGLYPRIVCRSDVAIELMIDGERKTGGPQESFEAAECPVEFLAAKRHRDPL
jgi:hypothetical protein